MSEPGLAEQLRWSAAMEVPAVATAGEALVVGMGGSGFAGDVASVVAEHQARRVSVQKSYGLPNWVRSAAPLVVAVSYSGNTEETLSGVDAASAEGLQVVGISTGGSLAEVAAERGFAHVEVPAGLQPRAAAGYLSGAVIQVLGAAGVIQDAVPQLEEAATVLDELVDGSLEDDASAIGKALAGKIALIYGATGLPAIAAARWKTQINENGKSPAWWTPLPELDHNEIVGWSAYLALNEQVAVVFLHDSSDTPRIRQRARLTADLMSGVHMAGVVESQGSGPLARLFSLVLPGDYVSLAMADAAGVDPVPVHVIEELKTRLKESPQ